MSLRRREEGEGSNKRDIDKSTGTWRMNRSDGMKQATRNKVFVFGPEYLHACSCIWTKTRKEGGQDKRTLNWATKGLLRVREIGITKPPPAAVATIMTVFNTQIMRLENKTRLMTKTDGFRGYLKREHVVVARRQ